MIPSFLGPYQGKALRFGAGALAALLAIPVASAGYLVGMWLAALFAALLVGVAYEFLRRYQRGDGSVSWLNAAATASGGAVISLLIFFFSKG